MQTSSITHRRLTRTDLISYLRNLEACDAAFAWIGETPGEPEDLWTACQRGDWMLRLLAAVNYDERALRHIACDCAMDVLHIYERAHPDDRRPRDAIAVARRYADGVATDDELIAADYAARAAAYAASDAASGAAARAAVWTAIWDVAWDADKAATWAAICWSAARVTTWPTAMSRQADMVRARVPWADVEQAMARAAAKEKVREA